MRALSATDLLAVWEAGQHQPHWERGLHLLAASCPESTRSDLRELSVGERDRRLLELRRLIFGPDLEALIECPVCRESLHLAFPSEHVLAPSSLPAHAVEVSGYRIEFRPVNCGDLECLPKAGDLGIARSVLAGRCVRKAEYRGKPIAFAELPSELMQTLAGALEEADPQANVELAVSCASCGHHWQQLFDIVAFLWAEIHAWSLRALYEVHQLAFAYGWSESEILAMNPARRQVYLEMLGT